jgi:hypothetical protein
MKFGAVLKEFKLRCSPKGKTMKFFLGGFCFVAFFLVGADKPMGNKADKEQEEKAKKEIEQKLAQKITIEKEDGGPLQDAVGYLEAKYDIPLVIDKKAFEKEFKIPDVHCAFVTLPKVKNVSLGEVLKKVLARVGGTFEIRNNKVQIIPSVM